MKTIDPDNIAELLTRFFDGETTCAEERALEKYFTSDTPLPPELEPYREMFGWYASGLDVSSLPSEKTENPSDDLVELSRRNGCSHNRTYMAT